MALNSLLCADVPLRTYTHTHTHTQEGNTCTNVSIVTKRSLKVLPEWSNCRPCSQFHSVMLMSAEACAEPFDYMSVVSFPWPKSDPCMAKLQPAPIRRQPRYDPDVLGDDAMSELESRRPSRYKRQQTTRKVHLRELKKEITAKTIHNENKLCIL